MMLMAPKTFLLLITEEEMRRITDRAGLSRSGYAIEQGSTQRIFCQPRDFEVAALLQIIVSPQARFSCSYSALIFNFSHANILENEDQTNSFRLYRDRIHILQTDNDYFFTSKGPRAIGATTSHGDSHRCDHNSITHRCCDVSHANISENEHQSTLLLLFYTQRAANQRGPVGVNFCTCGDRIHILQTDSDRSHYNHDDSHQCYGVFLVASSDAY